jgi:multiple sugar transport system ATP-binding protein
MIGTGVERLTVVRGGTAVLREVTLQAAEGELLVVLGASGSGKTTLLRVIAGLEQPSSGEVVIRGRQVTGLPPGQRRVAMAFEASALIPFLDVAHNVGWGLRVQRLPEAEVQHRVSGRARQLRLSRLLSRRPGELSDGERGLVGLGRALVQVPEVFLLDEALAGLDAGERAGLRRQVVEVIRSLGATAFYVTHDQAEGMAVADRVALLCQGSVVQVGRPMELYRRPVDLTAAGMVGTPPIGLLPARLVVAGGLAGFELGTRTLPLWRPVPPALRDHVGRAVVLGLRAEDVPDSATSYGPESVALDAMVTDVRYTGRQNIVTLAVAAPPVTAPGTQLFAGGPSGATLRSFFPPGAVLRPGDAVRVAVKAADAHVFDAVTGRALWHPEDASDD